MINTERTDEWLKDTENWYDFGLTEHLENTDKFSHWLDIAYEAARLCEAEEHSPIYELLLTVAAAAAKVGYDEDD